MSNYVTKLEVNTATEEGAVKRQMHELRLHQTLILTEQDVIAAKAEDVKQADVMRITKVPSGWLYSQRHPNVHSIVGYTNWITTFVPEQVDLAHKIESGINAVLSLSEGALQVRQV